jgi:hypothetical protein
MPELPRATGITTYLQNGGKLEVAQQKLAMNLRARQASTIAETTPSNSMRSRELRIHKAPSLSSC